MLTGKPESDRAVFGRGLLQSTKPHGVLTAGTVMSGVHRSTDSLNAHPTPLKRVHESSPHHTGWLVFTSPLPPTAPYPSTRAKTMTCGWRTFSGKGPGDKYCRLFWPRSAVVA